MGRRLARGVVLLLSVVPLLVACQPDDLRQPVQVDVERQDFPDPTVYFARSRYHAFATTTVGTTARNVQVMSSEDLYAWSSPAEALPEAPAWARPLADGGAFWAPTMTRIGGRFVLYFAAVHESTPGEDPGWCIGWAEADDPEGPYAPGDEPLLCRVLKQTERSPVSIAAPGSGRGVIDPQVFRAPNGATYLHVKALDSPWQVVGMGLAADGTSIRTDAYGMVHLPAKDGVWEYSPAADHRFTVVENPSMDFNPHAPAPWGYTLYYSGGDWRTAAYSTGVAACSGPVGPCFRATFDEPWLASRGTVRGPGGLSAFRAADGSRWVAYHSWERGQPTSNGRRLHVEPLGYDGITPVLLRRVPVGSLEVDVAAGQVTLRGVADDPDTGRPMEVILKEGPDRLAVLTVEADTTYTTTLAAEPGQHRYCAFVVDDHGLGTRQIGCQEVTVPAAAPAPSPSTSTSTSLPSPSTSTTSSSTSTTSSSTTVAADDDA